MAQNQSAMFHLSSEAVDRFAAAHPMVATFSGVSGLDHLWPDLSPDGHGQRRDLAEAIKSQAQSCNIGDDHDRRAGAVLVEYCESEMAFYDAGLHRVDLNNLTSPHQNLRHVFGAMGDQTPDQWEAIVARLETIDEPLDGFRQTLDEGIASGQVVSGRQVDTVIEQGKMVCGEGSSFDDLRRRLAQAPFDTAALMPRLERATAAAKDAFARFNNYLIGTYRPMAAEADSVGEERYVAASSHLLGTELDLRDTYRWGWDEVERLWAELQGACMKVDSQRSVPAVFDLLLTDPEYSAASQGEFIELMATRQQIALDAIDGVHFDIPPQIRAIDVKVEPAGGALAPHYVGPSEDFTRPGTVWYPIEGQTTWPLFQQVSTAYHEGYPGHHLQIGWQAAKSESLSRFHRMMVWHPGSGEGWALYAEHLMGELGFLERPEYQVGLLSTQLFRACRVAIDIGIHLDLPIPADVTFHPGERWSFDLAYELLRERGLESHDRAVSEVIRYFGWPGQAISYKVGERTILDLRAEAEAHSGSSFDAKAFHADILDVGSVGLDLLISEMRSNRVVR